tara:strand:+ start:1455 stop:1607 length:153 start_codon:yes stop_codon:yes gene_type:complete
VRQLGQVVGESFPEFKVVLGKDIAHQAVPSIAFGHRPFEALFGGEAKEFQ